MNEHIAICQNEADTEQLGRRIADVATPRDVVVLTGTLGAGKTRLVQAVARGLGIANQNVSSPTFVLINEYSGGRLPVYHFDVYRIKDDDEFLNLGPDEYFLSDGITFVEWGEKVDALIPSTASHITIEVIGETARKFTITGSLAVRLT